MKGFKFNTILSLFCLGGIMVFTRCSDDTTDYRLANEQRYFDLFVKSNYPDLSPTESGLFIEHIEEGIGASPDSGDWVLINYVITSIPSDKVNKKVLDTYYEDVAKENKIYQSNALYGSFKYQHGSEVLGVREGLKTIKEGGKSRFMFTSELGYGTSGTNFADPYTSLIYDIHLMELIGEIIPYEEEKIAEYLDTVPDAKQTAIYDDETGATMYYIEDVAGTGKAIDNDSVENVYYLGSLPDGRVFDSNIGGDPLEVVVGAGQVIRGWDIGLTYFKQGGKGRLVIPYKLAYGELGKATSNGKVAIPAYSTLIFEMEILDETAEEEE